MFNNGIAGYTYNTDNYCPGCIVGQLTTNPGDTHHGEHPSTTDPEQHLDLLARLATPPVDRADETTYDSGDFPKVILPSQVTWRDQCGNCGAYLDDNSAAQIELSGVTMLSYADATAEVAAVIAGTIETDNGELSDGAAKAIAAAWQSPGTVGNVLASLASGHAVNRWALGDDITATGRQADPMWPTELECLATWAINYDSTN